MYVCMYVCMYLCARHPSTIEGVIPMVDLMLTVLHFVIRAVSEFSVPGISPEEKEGGPTTQAQVRFPVTQYHFNCTCILQFALQNLLYYCMHVCM